MFITRHKVVHNGGIRTLKGLLFDKKTSYLAQILQNLSDKVCFIILPKFNTFGVLIPILGTSAIMDQTACCYNVTTSETGLYHTTRHVSNALLEPPLQCKATIKLMSSHPCAALRVYSKNLPPPPGVCSTIFAPGTRNSMEILCRRWTFG